VLGSRSDIDEVTGYNAFELMQDNHRHHAAFMSTVFCLGNYELLTRTIPWVYRAYSSRGYSYDYFPIELRAWVDALRVFADAKFTSEIVAIYNWMLERHEDMILLSQSTLPEPLPVHEKWLDRKTRFF